MNKRQMSEEVVDITWGGREFRVSVSGEMWEHEKAGYVWFGRIGKRRTSMHFELAKAATEARDALVEAAR
jgi:hypothetical protein